MTPSLQKLLDQLAATEPGIEAGGEPALADGAITWSRSGRTFAVGGRSGVELRLERAIAAAAMRTPDVGPSPRGAAWVRFNPRELDGHAVDRVTAWFELAYRLAGA